MGKAAEQQSGHPCAHEPLARARPDYSRHDKYGYTAGQAAAAAGAGYAGRLAIDNGAAVLRTTQRGQQHDGRGHAADVWWPVVHDGQCASLLFLYGS